MSSFGGGGSPCLLSLVGGRNLMQETRESSQSRGVQQCSETLMRVKTVHMLLMVDSITQSSDIGHSKAVDGIV